MTGRSNAMELNMCELEQVNGGDAKEKSIHAIDDLVKKILGPVTWDWEYIFDKNK